MVFTSRQILSGDYPILYVFHDKDGDWQFLSGKEEGEQDGRLINFDEIPALGNDLPDLEFILEGMVATRTGAGEPWTMSVFG
jgi:hypothetical protein